jgi:hypothetical protein
MHPRPRGIERHLGAAMRVAPTDSLQFDNAVNAPGDSSPSTLSRTSSMRERVASSFPAHFDGSPQPNEMRHSISDDRHDEVPDFTPEFAARLTRKFRAFSDQFQVQSGQPAHLEDNTPRSLSSLDESLTGTRIGAQREFEFDDEHGSVRSDQSVVPEIHVDCRHDEPSGAGPAAAYGGGSTGENCLVVLTAIAIGMVLYVLQAVLDQGC